MKLLSAEYFSYDNFTENGIANLYTKEHLIYIFATVFSVAALLYLSRNCKSSRFKKIHLHLAISLTALEIIRIIIHVINKSPYDYWIPLYYCGLFNFAIWFARSENEKLRIVGFSYITMGAILAGVIFTFYPSTTLGRYPLYHPETIYGAFFHGTMIYFGLLTLMRGKYTPRAAHLKYYFLFVTAASVIALAINIMLGTNCMFLSDPFGLPLLSALNDKCAPAYIIISWLGQSVLLFKFGSNLYRLTHKLFQQTQL